MPIVPIITNATGDDFVTGTASTALGLPAQTAQAYVAAITADQLLQPIYHSAAGIAGGYSLHVGVGSELLFRQATGLEKAMMDADAERLIAIDAELIVDIWDPYNCPYPLLPYLAWAMGVNFWNDDWSETTKRAWVAEQWDFKALRGSADGVVMAVDFAGRDVSPFGYAVNKIVTQPQQLFPGASVSAAAREAWLQSLPQVRVYFFQQTGTAPQQKFFIDTFIGTSATQPSWDGFSFPIPSTASERLGRAAAWVVGGELTDVPVDDYGSYFQLHLPGNAGAGMFMDTFLTPSIDDDEDDIAAGLSGTEKFCVPSTAWRRLVTIAPQEIGPYPIAVGPSLLAIEAVPQLVAAPGERGYGMFVGSNYYHGGGVLMAPSPAAYAPPAELPAPQAPPIFPSFLIPSTAKYRLYYMYAVYDPEDLPPCGTTPATMFCGYGRFGIADFTAEIDVSMPSLASPGAFQLNSFTMPAPSGEYLIPHDPEPLDYVCSAVEAARKMVDKCLLNPNPVPAFVAGAVFLAGIDSFVVGQALVSSA